MSIDVAFLFLTIVVTREARKREGVPQIGSARKETVRVEVVVAFMYFNSKTVGPNCRSGSTFKSMLSGH